MKMHSIEAEEPLAADSWGCMDFCNLADMDDIWSIERFPFAQILKEFPLDDILDDHEFDNVFDLAMEPTEPKEIVHHDCMWSGKCKDKSHPGNAGTGTETRLPRAATPVLTLAPPQLPAEPLAPALLPIVSPISTAAIPGRSLLIGAAASRPVQPVVSRPQIVAPRKTRAMMIPSPPSPRRPDTPQSLDEEDSPRVIKLEKAFDDDSEEDVEEEEDEGYEEDDFGYAGVRENTVVASDHSYTLSKNSKQARIDLPGVQTPSDSEEEIDVVSLGEKIAGAGGRPSGLPANPSPQTHRYLQRTMASAVAERSGLSSRPPPPQPRKRPRERSASPSPRHHRKRTKPAAKPRYQSSKRRPYSSPNSDSEAENIERRSLHNDMERMRRIGLKNLFDELKTEVPSIRHKERAPKVVVLREAAAFCMKLQKEEREMDQMKAKQQKLLAKVRQLRMELASRRPKNA